MDKNILISVEKCMKIRAGVRIFGPWDSSFVEPVPLAEKTQTLNDGAKIICVSLLKKKSMQWF